MKHLFLALCSFYLLGISFEDAVFPEEVPSARALAMGNAFLCKVDDASAAFYNPAGLGTIRYPHIHLSNFYLDLNRDLLSAGMGGTLSSALSNSVSLFSLDGNRRILANQLNRPTNLSLGALPNLTTRYFSMGYLYSLKRRMVITSMTAPTGLEYADRLDHGPYAALNFSLFGGILKVGTSGALLLRSESTGTALASTTLAPTPKTGSMFLVTSGLRLTLPIEFLPTLALVSHNTFQSAFSGSNPPAKVPPTFDLGASLTPQLATNSRMHLEINYKDVTQVVGGVSQVRRILFGVEFDYYRVFFLRLGYGDGFGSIGLGVKSRNLDFDFSTYAVDTSSSSFRGKEDRRFILGLSSGI